MPSLDPERVADAIVARAADWLPAPAWVVYAIDNAGVRTFGARGVTADARAGGGRDRAVGAEARRGLRGRRRRRPTTRFGGGRQRAAMAFPLECRGRTVGALVGLDKAPSAREPAVRAGDAGGAPAGAGAGGDRAR